MTDSDRSIVRSMRHFFSGTMLSRVTGMVREMSMAFVFGVDPLLGSFLVAFRFANLARRLFGENSFSGGFIPQFEERLLLSKKEGALFFRDFFFSLALFLAGLLLFSEVALFLLIKSSLISPSTKEIFSFASWILPGIMCICLFGATSALHHTQKKFFLPAFSSAFSNIVWIFAVWLMKEQSIARAMVGLSVAITLGYALQLGVTIPFTFSYLRAHLNIKELFAAKVFNRNIRALLKPISLTLIGIGSIQINTALDALFARYVAGSGPAYLWYAARIEQMPLALFGVALSSAILPPLARALAAGDREAFSRLFFLGLQRSFTLIFPSMVAAIFLAPSIISFLYGHGHFQAADVIKTTHCLWGYLFGLVPTAFVMVQAPAFYALKDYKTPTYAAFLSLIINVGLNAFFILKLRLGVESIAYATSAAALVQALFLFSVLKKEVGKNPCKTPFALTSLSTLLAAVVTTALLFLVFSDPFIPLVKQGVALFISSKSLALIGLLFGGLLFSLLFLFFSKVFRQNDIFLLLKRE